MWPLHAKPFNTLRPRWSLRRSANGLQCSQELHRINIKHGARRIPWSVFAAAVIPDDYATRWDKCCAFDARPRPLQVTPSNIDSGYEFYDDGSGAKLNHDLAAKARKFEIDFL